MCAFVKVISFPVATFPVFSFVMYLVKITEGHSVFYKAPQGTVFEA